jgi:hypothetical protein
MRKTDGAPSSGKPTPAYNLNSAHNSCAEQIPQGADAEINSAQETQKYNSAQVMRQSVPRMP